MTEDRSALVLFAHGSRDPRWRATFENLLEEVAAIAGGGSVHLAYMEFVRPTLEEVVSDLVRQGVARIRVLPLFMSGGGHVANDVPEQARATANAFSGVEMEVLPPIGECDEVRRAMRDVCVRALTE
jgi:sirohydrochlorin cobaltochelatase